MNKLWSADREPIIRGLVYGAYIIPRSFSGCVQTAWSSPLERPSRITLKPNFHIPSTSDVILTVVVGIPRFRRLYISNWFELVPTTARFPKD